MKRKANLSYYEVGDRAIFAKDDNGYPFLEGEVIEKIPKMLKINFGDNSYFGKPNIRWISAEEWWVVARLP